MWTMMDEAVDEQVREAKQQTLTDLPTEVVEIGPGLGSTFSYYRPGTRVIAFEPNRWFRSGLEAAADEHGIELDLRDEPFGPGSLEPESHDAVVSCLTMCSVGDVTGVLEEVGRGLRPGGRFAFIEHIAAEGGPQAMYQRLIRAPWRALGDGCDPRSRFLDFLRESPLQVDGFHLERLGSNLDPTNLVAWGTAYRT
jgi:SAM-dependent methyltransferase